MSECKKSSWIFNRTYININVNVNLLVTFQFDTCNVTNCIQNFGFQMRFSSFQLLIENSMSRKDLSSHLKLRFSRKSKSWFIIQIFTAHCLLSSIIWCREISEINLFSLFRRFFFRICRKFSHTHHNGAPENVFVLFFFGVRSTLFLPFLTKNIWTIVYRIKSFDICACIYGYTVCVYQTKIWDFWTKPKSHYQNKISFDRVSQTSHTPIWF